MKKAEEKKKMLSNEAHQFQLGYIKGLKEGKKEMARKIVDDYWQIGKKVTYKSEVWHDDFEKYLNNYLKNA